MGLFVLSALTLGTGRLHAAQKCVVAFGVGPY